MAWLIDAIANFPTAVYTVLLAVLMVYWFFVLLGIVDRQSAPFSDDSLKHVSLFLNQFGLSGAPLELVATLLVTSAWFITFISKMLLQSFATSGGGGWLTLLGDTVLLIAAFFLALLVTRLGIAPLRKETVQDTLDEVETVKQWQDYIGDICHITSGRVNEKFGEASVDGADTVTVQVRCQSPAKLRRGESALITEFDSDKNLYWVEPYQDPLV